jgi:hypothetical protein
VEVLFHKGENMLVKFRSRDGQYMNIGIKTASGYIIPIKVVVSKHYYNLLDLAKEEVIQYKEKEGGN